MKSTFSVYDPSVQQALLNQKSSYVVPPMAGLPPPEQGFGVDTSQPLTPDLQAMGAAQAQQIEQERAQADQMAAMIAYEHAPQPQPTGGLSLDWQPPLARVTTPDAVQQDAPQEPVQQEEPAPVQAMPQPSVRQPAQPRSGNRERMDEAFTGMGDAITQRQQTAEELGQARAETGRATADLLQASTVDDAAAQKRLADAQDAHIAASDKVQQEQRELTQFIGNYEPKDRRTTTSRVMGAIAVGLAGMQDQNNLVAGLKQGMNVQTNNAAMVNNMINTSIDRDIDLQRQMLDNKRTALAAKSSELGQMRERYGDGVESIKLARAMKIDQYQKELEAVIARGGSKEAVLTAQDAIGMLEQQKQQLFFERSQSLYQQEMASRAAAARANRPMTAKEALDLRSKELDIAKKEQDLRGGGDTEQDIPGYVRTKKVSPALVTEATKTAQGVAALNSGLQQLAELESRNRGRAWSAADRVLGEDIISQYADASSQLAGGGQAGEAAKKDALERIPNPTDWRLPTRADPQEVYRGLIERNERTAAAKLKAAGYEPDEASQRRARVKPGVAK